MRSEQNCCILLTFSNAFSLKNCVNFKRISLKYVLEGPIDNKSALVEVAPYRQQAITCRPIFMESHLGFIQHFPISGIRIPDIGKSISDIGK